MERTAAACLAAMMVLGACAGSEDGAAVDNTPPVVADEHEEVDRPAGALLLVGSGEGFETLAVLDPESGELDPVETPSGIGDAMALAAVAGEGGDHVLVTTVDDAMYLWHRRDDTSSSVGTGGRVLAVAPPLRPVAALVETNEGLRLVDLGRGNVHDLPAPTGPTPLPRLTVDAEGLVGVVVDPNGGATAIDLVRGTIEQHDPELLFLPDGLSADGSTVIAGRRSGRGSAVEAVPVFDPASPQVWYRPETPDAQLAVAWVGGELLAVDLSGRVSTITDGNTLELGVLRASEEAAGPTVAPGLIHPDPVQRSSAVALIEERGSGPSRWFRVDVATGVVDELPGIEGHTIVASALAGHLLVGVGSAGDGYSSLRLVRLADGSVVELLADPSAPLVTVRSVSESVVGLSRFDRGLAETELFDLGGAPRGAISGPLGFTANPDVSQVALFFPDGAGGSQEAVTRIVTVDGSASDLVYPGLHPLAWLPAA